MTGATIEFHFADPAAEQRFLDDYLAAAWDRFDARDYWTHGWFWRYGQFAGYEAGPDGGLVRLVFDGDPGALVEAERNRWDAFEGLESWTCRRYDEPETDEGSESDEAETYESLLAQQRAAKGDVGGEREYLGKAVTARFALELAAVYDERPPAAPEPGEDDPAGIGMWALLHDLLVQLGYDWYDETDAAVRMLENRMKSVAAYRGADAAREEYERVLAAWRDYGDDLDDWLAKRPTGEASEP